MTKRNSYTKEFKLEAIRLLESGEKPGADIARELGIRRNMLYKWQQQLNVKAGEAFKGAGRKPKSESSDVDRLQAENARLREEVEILKKAAAYFARELK